MLEQLKQIPNWVNWIADKNSKEYKKPINPLTGYGADASDKSTWANYETAINKSKYVGFEMGEKLTDNNFVALDLDHVIDAEGNLAQWARGIIDSVDSYTEISPSGIGIRIFCVCTDKTFIKQNKKTIQVIDGVKQVFEIYGAKHYLTVTENVFEGRSEIQDRTAECQAVYKNIFSDEEKTPTKTRNEHTATLTAHTALTDNEVIEKIKGSKFAELYSGNFSAYPSQNEADLALCSALAFFTNENSAQIDRIFKTSNLYREKWDEKHNSDGSTYGAITIQKAVNTVINSYGGYSENEKKLFRFAQAVMLNYDNETAMSKYREYAPRYELSTEQYNKIWNDAKNSRVVTGKELKQTDKKQTAKENKFAKLDSLRHGFDVTKKIEKTEYIGGLFARGYVSAIVGASGVGKTIFEQKFFTDLSKGGDIFGGVGHEDKPRKTIVVAGEFGERGLIERAQTFDNFDADKNNVEVFDVLEYERNGISFTLDTPEGQENIEYIARSRPDIMFFDSFGTLYTGKENDNGELLKVFRFLMKIAREYNIAVVIIHHNRKRTSTEQKNLLTLDDMIGGNAIARSVALVLAIEYNYEYEVNVVRCLKSWGNYFKPFTYKIKKGFYGHSYLVFDLNPEWLNEKITLANIFGKEPKVSNTGTYSNISLYLTGRGEQGASVKEIVTVTGKNESTIKSQLKRMTDKGIITPVQNKRGFYKIAQTDEPVEADEVLTQIEEAEAQQVELQQEIQFEADVIPVETGQAEPQQEIKKQANEAFEKLHEEEKTDAIRALKEFMNVIGLNPSICDECNNNLDEIIVYAQREHEKLTAEGKPCGQYTSLINKANSLKKA